MGFLGSSTIPWGPLIGIGSFVFLLGMQGFQSRIGGVLKKIPPALIVVAVATLIATVWNLPLKRVHVPDQLMDDFSFPSLSQWMGSINFLILEVALTIFFLASTESLLSASAIDQMKEGHTTNYSRELMAQGIGNILCGLVGAVPIAGVVIRSTANIASGATTRASSIFHGVWLLAMVGIFPFILDDVPMSILGAILVFSVLKLINLGQINEMAKSDRWAWPMYLGTAVAVLTVNPMVGVGIGIGLQCAKSVYTSLNLGKVIPSHEEINIPARVDQAGD
jgi:MFS superfamily sulfate permease-like transporter